MKRIKNFFVQFVSRDGQPVSVSMESMSAVIERRKPKIDRNGNWRISQEMIAEAKALDRAKGVPGMTEETMEEALAAARGKPDSVWKKVEIEDLKRELGGAKPDDHS